MTDKPCIVNDSILSLNKCRAILLEEKNRREGKVNYVWKTAKGELIPLKEMTDKHLDNCIKLVERVQFFEDEVAHCIDPVWDFGDRS